MPSRVLYLSYSTSTTCSDADFVELVLTCLLPRFCDANDNLGRRPRIVSTFLQPELALRLCTTSVRRGSRWSCGTSTRRNHIPSSAPDAMKRASSSSNGAVSPPPLKRKIESTVTSKEIINEILILLLLTIIRQSGGKFFHTSFSENAGELDLDNSRTQLDRRKV